MSALAVTGALGAGQLAAGIFGNRSANQQAERARRDYQAAALPVRQTAGQLSGMGQGLYQNYGLPAFGQGVGYYSRLLGAGGRQAMNAAVAPAAANIAQTYEGAARGIPAGDRSGTASLQKAQLEQQKAGQIARLLAGVQPMAADKLIGAGQFGVGAGLGAIEGAGNLYSNLLGPAAGERSRSLDASLQTSMASGRGVGDLLSLLVSQAGGDGGGSRTSSNRYPSTPTNIGGYSFLLPGNARA